MTRRAAVVALLVGTNQDSDSAMTVHDLAQEGDVDKLCRLLRHDPNALHERNDLGWTPLHIVAAQGPKTRQLHSEVALIEAGADVDARDAAGQTPLHLIAMNGSVESVGIAVILLENGADVRAKSVLGDWRRYWQHGDRVRQLLIEYERRT